MNSSDRITGRCPVDHCPKSFVETTVSEIGDHFNEHLPYTAPPEIAGGAALRLMDHRRAAAYGRPPQTDTDRETETRGGL